jgi:hypothetical protein
LRTAEIFVAGLGDESGINANILPFSFDDSGAKAHCSEAPMEALLQIAGYAGAVAAAAVIVVGIEALNERCTSPSGRAPDAPGTPRGLRALVARLRQGRA